MENDPIHQSMRQASLPGFSLVDAAVNDLAQAGIEERGAIFTRREVVEFILNLVGYTSDKPLQQLRLLEPSFGDGDFLLIAVERLLAAWQAQDTDDADPYVVLRDSVCAVELHQPTFERTRGKVIELLEQSGIPNNNAETIVKKWLIQGDFLLTPLSYQFDFVVGNPPYVRQELSSLLLL